MDEPRIVFMGTTSFSVTILRALIEKGHNIVAAVTQPDRPTGRKRVLTPPPVKIAAESYGIPVLQPARIRDQESHVAIRRVEPTLLITAAYGQILPEALLSLPIHGALNVHASLLPKRRGGAPIQRAILEGDSVTGVTVMNMVKAMDAGGMWGKVYIPIDQQMTYGELQDLLAEKGAELLVDLLPLILDKSIVARPQDDTLATFSPVLTRADEQLDFTQNAQRVAQQIRALAPRPGAYTQMGDKVLKIWYATVESRVDGTEQPGTVIELTEKGPRIACKNGTIIAESLQLEGKVIQSGREFQQGQRNLLGTQFKVIAK
ncbi:methionyl-tRNA formyltransferase [Ferroacidibacillus organovorans]|uniref:Methionyl-tRNA formyltransferase n=1 Tax=Ferroacidibacillus organovorans TaxID=1765683 RepID=A0A101XQB2_9BACL|nr:methionyl-tRNA formyltransferase [Ferroacidibacillus organovorans]KUO95593.1 hypothetical protein ATW55_06870 [Ferroacidibacillus organovorans]